ncbi:MAG: hypothetical protein ABIP65_05815 [Vicinamibacterales bacterium]
MDSTLALPAMTALDAVTQIIAAVLYMGVGTAALAHAPRDERARVFFAFALMNCVAFGIPTFGWFVGETNPLAMHRLPLALMLSGLAIGALLLFHFSQVFPRRRPWIKGAGPQLAIAYALTPIAVVALTQLWPEDPARASLPFIVAFIVFGFPLMVLLGGVLPFAGIVSLLRSYRETATPAGVVAARQVLSTILLSQVAGGVLAVVFAPVLTRIAPDSLALTAVTMTIWALGLLTPIAFASGVWRNRLLEVDPG